LTAVSGLRGKKGRSLAGAANVSQQRAIQGHEEARETKKGNQQETMGSPGLATVASCRILVSEFQLLVSKILLFHLGPDCVVLRGGIIFQTL